MDKDLRELQREYQATGDLSIGARMIAHSLRANNIVDEIFYYLRENANLSRPAEDEEIIYISWNAETNLVRVIAMVAIYYSPNELREECPSPRLPEHMSRRELEDYERQMENYLWQEKGEAFIYSFRYNLSDNLEWGEPTITQMSYNSPERFTPRYLPYVIYGSPPSPPGPPVVEILNTISKDREFSQKVVKLEEPQFLDFGGTCEDYPACGHDICPRRWEDGTQAEVVCICGATLPPNSRSSLCNFCLRRPADPYEDAWYDDPFEGEFDDYDDDY